MVTPARRSDPFVAHCLELLAPHGAVRSRAMFGGHGLYVDDLFVAIVAFDTLFLKVNEATKPAFEAAGCRPFRYEGKGEVIVMSYWTVPEEAMDSPPAMAPWARRAIEAAVAQRGAKGAKAPSGKAPATRAPRAPPPPRR
jgi:DNA transformation protein